MYNWNCFWIRKGTYRSKTQYENFPNKTATKTSNQLRCKHSWCIKTKISLMIKWSVTKLRMKMGIPQKSALRKWQRKEKAPGPHEREGGGLEIAWQVPSCDTSTEGFFFYFNKVTFEKRIRKLAFENVGHKNVRTLSWRSSIEEGHDWCTTQQRTRFWQRQTTWRQKEKNEDHGNAQTLL